MCELSLMVAAGQDRPAAVAADSLPADTAEVLVRGVGPATEVLVAVMAVAADTVAGLALLAGRHRAAPEPEQFVAAHLARLGSALLQAAGRPEQPAG
jgi:hypothetical protein